MLRFLRMTVHVFTRHSRTCTHKKDRAWKKCNCTKWLMWHLTGKMYRRSTKSRDWNVAAKLARQIEEKHERALLGTPAPDDGATLEGAISLFLMDRESQHLKSSTLRKLETIFKKQMLTWFHDLDVRLLRDVTLPQLIAWRGSWSDGPLAAKKKQERVRGFFWFAFRNKWITDNPALGLSKIKADIRPAVPFSPTEFAAIVSAIDSFGKTDAQRARIRAMVMLLRYSGLAIRDAVCLERHQLGDDDRLLLRRAKTGIAVSIPLRPELADMLRTLQSDNQRFFFWSGNGLPKSAVSDWQRALRRLFTLADIKHADEKPKRCHPHQFRHTFSIELLRAGVSIEDVARLLGHSSVRTTEKYYAAWVQSRADALESAVRKTW
jgi:integrase/recombinase XerD